MKPKRQPKNIAAQAFPEQFARLRPERSEAGGVKARSGGEARRMEVYGAIKAVYLHARPVCEGYDVYPGCGQFASEVHHRAGREGLLLFDVRRFAAVCRSCHEHIHARPDEAFRLGFLEKRAGK